METYKVIEGFENYSVSDHGNVKNNKTGHIMSQHFNPGGYVICDLYKLKKQYSKSIHTLVAKAFVVNTEQKAFVDHIDNNPKNNAPANLRWATSTQNNQNSSMRKDNKSGVKGVNWKKTTQKWRAQIKIDGINVHLGYFTELEDAKQARMIRANQAFGVFTNTCEKII